MDLAKDRNVDDWNAVFLVSIYAIGDLSARLLSGIIADKGFLQKSSMMAASFVLWTAVMCLAPFCSSYHLHVIVSLSSGWCTGISVVLIPVILMDLAHPAKFSITYGFMCLSAGLVLLARPALIGMNMAKKINQGDCLDEEEKIGTILLSSILLAMKQEEHSAPEKQRRRRQSWFRACLQDFHRTGYPLILKKFLALCLCETAGLVWMHPLVTNFLQASQHLTNGTAVGYVEETQDSAAIAVISEDASPTQHKRTTPLELEIDSPLPTPQRRQLTDVLSLSS
ncbi:hypothetical protein HPB47_024334, partial [Ixodes persulcatus]